MELTDPVARTIIATIRAGGFDVSHVHDVATGRARFNAWPSNAQGVYQGGERWHGEGENEYQAAVALAEAVGRENLAKVLLTEQSANPILDSGS